MGDRKWSFKSKEDQTQQISNSVYVTNFPDHICARDLWKICNDYGSVVDVFIPLKKSKVGKRFAFIRFIKVFNLERLIEYLCTIWIGSFHLHANIVRFQRDQKPKSFTPNVPSTGNPRGTFASVLKGGNPNQVSSDHSEPALVLDDSCIIDRDFCMSLMGQVKEASAIPNLYIILSKEGFHSVKLTYLGGLWVLIQLDSLDSIKKFRNHSGVRSWFSLIKSACKSFVSDERIFWVSVEGLPINAWSNNTFSKVASKWGELMEWEDLEENSLSCKKLCLKTKIDVIINERFKIILKGKVYWIRAKELDPWVPKFISDKIDDYSSDDESNDVDEGGNCRDKEFEKDVEDNDIDRVS